MMDSLQRWFTFSKPTLFNMWWLAVQWSHETLKLLHHIKTKYPALKHKPLEFFKRKKCEHEELKQLLKATTSSNVSALRASFLVANCIAKTKTFFTVGEELILPAAMDICCELLWETAVQKVACVPLWASTVTRRLDEITEEIEAQLLGLMSRHGRQSRLTSPPMLTTRQQFLFLCCNFFRRICMRICYVHSCCQPTLQLQSYSSLWLYIRKTKLVILYQYMHGWSVWQDWTAFWFPSLGQRGWFCVWGYSLGHP